MWTASLEVTRTGASRGFVTCAITRVCNRSPKIGFSNFLLFNFENFPLPSDKHVRGSNSCSPKRVCRPHGCHKFNQICKILFEGQFVEMLSNFCGHRNRKLTNELRMRFRSRILKLLFWNRNFRIFMWAANKTKNFTIKLHSWILNWYLIS